MKVRWLGHAGFKFQFDDPSDSSVTRTVYIDTWPDGPTFPASAKDELNDADLILVTHGHFDHSAGAPALFNNAKENGKDPKIVCIFEMSKFFASEHQIPDTGITPMNKGCPVDFGFCSVTMVGADHSSGCMGADGKMCYGGNPVGFILEAAGKRIYHAGDTNVFSDMQIITELYEPEYAFLPVGGHFTMGPKEAAYSLAKFLTSVKTVFPMHYGTFPLLKGTPEELREHFEAFKSKFNREDIRFLDSPSYLDATQELD